MKVLYHHRTTAQDGSAVHIDGLMGALRAEGHEVVVVAPPVATTTQAAGGWLSKLRRRLPRAVHEVLELLYNLPEAVRLAGAVRTHQPDVIYERSNVFSISGALLARHFAIPRISEVNAPYFLERSQYGGIALKRLARWTEDFAWRRADAVIPVTQVLARIVENSGVASERIHVMSNGVDVGLLNHRSAVTGVREKLGWNGKIVLGFTGFVREWNGLDSILDLLAAPGNESLVLLIVGDGTARGALEGRAAALGIGSRLYVTGCVERSDIPHWVSAFDIALQPAANPYASPLKLFEYMALGRAIVAPDQANIREILRHDHNALLFNPGDQSSLSAAVGRLARDEVLRSRLAANAFETIAARNLTWSSNARRVTEIVRILPARRARPEVGAIRSLTSR